MLLKMGMLSAVASKKYVSVSPSLVTSPTSTSHNSVSGLLGSILSGQIEINSCLVQCDNSKCDQESLK